MAAIALSNHGGRLEVICDGGVRRGNDIVKAVALGATACMIGRANLYGLGRPASGESSGCWNCSMLTPGGP
jgi:isopentenyl diphosphate isomerase/L-lactate dehydrogenase-like FMN-dependent dehydrogenase